MTTLNGVVLYTHVRVPSALVGINDPDTAPSGASSHTEHQEGCKIAITFSLFPHLLLNKLINQI